MAFRSKTMRRALVGDNVVVEAAKNYTEYIYIYIYIFIYCSSSGGVDGGGGVGAFLHGDVGMVTSSKLPKARTSCRRFECH